MRTAHAKCNAAEPAMEATSPPSSRTHSPAPSLRWRTCACSLACTGLQPRTRGGAASRALGCSVCGVARTRRP